MRREFYRESEMWWSKGRTLAQDTEERIEICIGDSVKGPYGEFHIAFDVLDDRGPYAQLRIYEDAWLMLPHCADLFAALPTLGKTPSVQQVSDLLRSLGFEDVTQPDNPSGENPEEQTDDLKMLREAERLLKHLPDSSPLLRQARGLLENWILGVR